MNDHAFSRQKYAMSKSAKLQVTAKQNFPGQPLGQITGLPPKKTQSDKNVTNTGHSSSASKESYTIFGTSAADGW